MSTYVETTVTDAIATITIDRAERHNSLVPALLEELLDSISATAADPEVRVIVLQTAGPSFSTGGDVAAFYEHRADITAYAERTVGLLNEVILALLRVSQPVVTAVDGQVTGGSLGLLLASDLVVMTDAATITPYYAVVGYSPDGGWTAILPEIIGRKRTVRVLSTNETITAEQAVQWGLASELTEGDPKERAQSVAARITTMKQGTVEEAKRLVGPDPDEVAMALDAERQAFVAQIQTDEALEGMETFLE